MLILSTCSDSPASSFPGLRKAGRGAGNEATHSSGMSGLIGESCYVSTRSVASWVWSVTL